MFFFFAVMAAFIDPICGFGLHAFDFKSPSPFLTSVMFSFAIFNVQFSLYTPD